MTMRLKKYVFPQKNKLINYKWLNLKKNKQNENDFLYI